jgi:hypothetical protein
VCLSTLEFFRRGRRTGAGSLEVRAARATSGRLPALAIVVAASMLAASAFVVGTTPDEEELRFAVLSSWLHVHALAEGAYPFWTFTLGLGSPHPLVPNFLLHPLVPLLAVMSPVMWVRLLLLLHTALGVVGMWVLGRSLGLRPMTNAACVCTFLFSAPSQQYLLTDFWPSYYVVWTSAPWLLLALWRVLESDVKEVRRWSIVLGLGAGLVAANSNPAYFVVYMVPAGAILATHWRALGTRSWWLVIAALMAVAISSPNLAQLATEYQFFSTAPNISNLPDPLPYSAAWDVFLRPLSRSGRPWQLDTIEHGTRTLFFGGPFAVLCLLGCLRFELTRRDLALAVVLCTVVLFSPLLPMTFVSARFLFRDPLVLCAIAMAGLAADRVLNLQRVPAAIVVLLWLQIGTVAASAWPFLEGTWQPEALQAAWFRGATGETSHVDTLVSLMPASGRLLYSPEVDHEVFEKALLREGLGVNALAYRGVRVVNAWLKAAAADSLSPSDRLFYGHIRTPPALITSDEGLDVLGIRYVLANRSELIAAGLRERGSIPKARGSDLVLYENPDAWPEAVVVDDSAASVDLPLRTGCGHDRLLCRDLAPITQLRRPGAAETKHDRGRIEVRLTPSDDSRLLLVTEMFRPDWVASSKGRRLQTTALFGALIGVRVPPGTISVRLDYRPPAALTATIAAWSALLGGFIVLAVESRSRLARA